MTLDVAGIVGVAVRNARPGDLFALRRQLGSMNEPLGERPADIEIDYVDEPTAGDLRLIGVNDAATDGEGFFLWGEGGGDAPISLAMGSELPFRLRVPRGTTRIPLLVHLVSAAATHKGYLPLHASAFQWRGRGVLVAGWSKGGKSEALLSFMERDASYVGDEWLFMSPDEPVVSGIPEPIRIWDWHLDELPELRTRLGRAARARLAALRLTGAALDRAAGAVRSRVVRKVADLATGRRHVRVDPVRLFGARHCVHRSRIDVVFLMVSSETDAVEVAEADPRLTARRIAASTRFEHLRLLEMELKHGYARPDGGTPGWDALQTTGETLQKRLADLPVYEVVHPYPVSTARLFWKMAPVVQEADP